MKLLLSIFIFFCFLNATFSQPALDSSIVAYYPMEGTARDRSGNGNDGQVFGNPKCVPGQNGNALLFDGVNDFIRVSHSTSFENIRKELTITGWAFPISLYGGGWLTILTKGITQVPQTSFSVIYNSNQLIPYLRFFGQNDYISLRLTGFPNSLRFNEWNFFAWRFQNGKITIFLNDQIVATYQLNFSELGIVDEPLDIARDSPGAVEYYHGILDELCFFSRALSNDEILTLFNEGKIAQNGIRTEVTKHICTGETYEGYNQSGIYQDTFSSAFGCDSIRVLNLSIVNLLEHIEHVTICVGDNYQGYTEPGSYRDLFTTTQGCDSLRILNLAVIGPVEQSLEQSICEGETYLGYTKAGTYIDTILVNSNCDTIRQLELTVNSIYIPNVFSPNGDGINDRFEVFSNNQDLLIRKYQIFDRWGAQLYNDENFSLKTSKWWDGQYLGQQVNNGVYIYYISAECASKIIPYYGTVTIMR